MPVPQREDAVVHRRSPAAELALLWRLRHRGRRDIVRDANREPRFWLGAAALGLTNVDAKLGYAEELPAEDGSVDVVISNGVINLCPDKMAVMQGVHRVLKTGGRFQIADIIVQKPVDQDAKDDIDLWSG